jgi:hypothetical protein
MAPKNVSASVSVGGTQKIAQLYVAGSSAYLVSVRVNVTYNGSTTPVPLISVCDAVNNVPSNVLGSVTASKNDLTLSDSDNLLFDKPLAQSAGKTYAIVVEYPAGVNSETFQWASAASSGKDAPCCIYDGSGWSQVPKTVCEFVVYSSDPTSVGGVQPTSKGPVV